MRRAALVIALSACGCGQSFAPASFVEGLRLLGARADPAEAAPGERVALTAWTVDTRGRTVDVRWDACLLPPIAGMGTINDACLDLDMGNGFIAFGSGDMIAATVPAIAPSMLLPPDITGGQYLPIRMTVRAQSDDDSGVYRLRLPGPGARNQNPSLASIDVVTETNGKVTARQSLDANQPLSVHGGQTLILRAMFTAESAESYVVQDAGGTTRSVTETLNVQWFATGGSLDNETSGADTDETFKLDKRLPAPGSVIDLWVVGHDERGGTDIMHRQLRLQ